MERLKGTPSTISEKLGNLSRRLRGTSLQERWTALIDPSSKGIKNDPPVNPHPSPVTPTWFKFKEPLEKLGAHIGSISNPGKRLGSKHSSYLTTFHVFIYVYIYVQPFPPVE